MDKMKSKARKKMLEKLKKSSKDEMYGDMGEKMKEMQKVTVASDSKEGLEKGLSKAQKILKARMEDYDEDGDDYSCGGVKKKKKKY